MSYKEVNHVLSDLSGLSQGKSPENEVDGLFASCILAIFSTKSSLRDQNLVPDICPTETGLNLWDYSQGLKLVPATRF